MGQGWWQWVKDDFRLSSPPQSDFYRSQWERDSSKVSLPYIIFRFFILLYFFVGTPLSWSCGSEATLYFIYLTNWTFTVQGVYAALYFGRLLWLWFAGTKDVPPETLPWPERVIWVLLNIISAAVYIVTLGYWAIIFSPAHWETQRLCGIAADLMVHALQSPLVLVDLFVMKIPIHVTHAIFPIIYGFCYVSFAGFYELGGGVYAHGRNYIYGVINWKEYPVGASIASIVGVICAGIFHLIFAYGFYRLRVFIHKKCSKGKDAETQALISRPSNSKVQTEEIGADAIESNAEMGEDRPPNYNTIEKA